MTLRPFWWTFWLLLGAAFWTATIILLHEAVVIVVGTLFLIWMGWEIGQTIAAADDEDTP